MEKEILFWRDGYGDGEYQGGIYYRDLEIHKFIKKIEDEFGPVTGIKLDDEGKNLEFICLKK